MNRHHIFVLAALLLVACKSSEKTKTSDKATESEAPKAETAAAVDSKPTSDKRSQFDLAAAIRVAERLKDEDDRADGFFDIVDDWRGKRYRWTVYYLQVFCPSAERCNVVPFDRGGKDKDIVQGWSPKLVLAVEEWNKIKQGCPAEAPQCRVTFEGTLALLTLSTQELTSLRFDDVKIVDIDPNI